MVGVAISQPGSSEHAKVVRVANRRRERVALAGTEEQGQQARRRAKPGTPHRIARLSRVRPEGQVRRSPTFVGSGWRLLLLRALLAASLYR